MDLSFHLMIVVVILINAIQPTNERMTQTVRIPQLVRIMQMIVTIAPTINYIVAFILCLTLYQRLSMLLINYQYENFSTEAEITKYSIEGISAMILLYCYIFFFDINGIYKISVLLYIGLSSTIIYKSVLDILRYDIT